MARKPAENAGYGAYDDGESLSANPFRFDEEHAEWEAWRTGWINASSKVALKAMPPLKVTNAPILKPLPEDRLDWDRLNRKINDG